MTSSNDLSRGRLASVLSAHEERFDELLRIAGLDPHRHLRFADLRHVDFGGSTLVGWDFTGADLRGASFRDASVRNCIFRDAIGVDLAGAIRVHPSEVRFTLPAIEYKDSVLHADDVNIAEIAAVVSTPFYCYSASTMKLRFEEYQLAFPAPRSLISYSVKANSNQAILATLATWGAGASVVSAGELRRAIAANFPPDRIIFSGPGKSQTDLALAIDKGISFVTVESEPELQLVSDVASAKRKTIGIAIRMRPDFPQIGEPMLRTQSRENKFGISASRLRMVYRHAASLPGLDIKGVSIHIGSSISDLKAFAHGFSQLGNLTKELRSDGHVISVLNLGGGLAIPTVDSATVQLPKPADLAALVEPYISDLNCTLVLEPGRYLVGNAGLLIAQVLYVKRGEYKNFVIVDAAMNDLIRPTLYEAYHEICHVVAPRPSAHKFTADIVGPVCESGDFLALERELTEPKPGDLIAIMSAGAYCAVQSTNYNTRPTVPEVMTNDGQFAVVRQRVGAEALIGRDRVPEWLLHYK